MRTVAVVKDFCSASIDGRCVAAAQDEPSARSTSERNSRRYSTPITAAVAASMAQGETNQDDRGEGHVVGAQAVVEGSRPPGP